MKLLALFAHELIIYKKCLSQLFFIYNILSEHLLSILFASVIESGSYSDMAFQNMLPEVDSDDYRMAISLAMEAACPKTVLGRCSIKTKSLMGNWVEV